MEIEIDFMLHCLYGTAIGPILHISFYYAFIDVSDMIK